MHPSSLMCYYPTYALLDEVRSYSDPSEINLFIDLKNCFQTLYQEHTILNVINNSVNREDSSIVTSFLAFISFHKLYALKRGLNINFYIFLESGKSYYHKNISKEYKINREIDDLFGLPIDSRDAYFRAVNNNYKLIEKVGNKLPNVKVFRLLNFEADFIPYYLISRDKINQSDDTTNIIYSSDHDLMQTLYAGDNVFIFQKVKKTKRIIKRNYAMIHELKRECDLPDELLPLALAIIGDPGDDVYGVKTIGPARFHKVSQQLINMIGSVDELYDNVLSKRPIFDTTKVVESDKYLDKIIKSEQLISDNLKLVSFELISRFFENPDNTETLNRQKQVDNILMDDFVASEYKLRQALEMNQVIVDDYLEIIYHNQ